MTEQSQQIGEDDAMQLVVRMDKHLFRELAVHVSTELSDEHRQKFITTLDPDDAWSGWPWARYYWLGENPASLVLATSFLKALADVDVRFEVARCDWPNDSDESGPGPAGYMIGTDYLA